MPVGTCQTHSAAPRHVPQSGCVCWDLTLGQKGWVPVLFLFCVLFLHLQYLRGVRRVLGKLVSTPAPGIAQPWDRARGGGGAEHVLGVRRWNSLGLGEPPSPLPPRAGRPRQPLEDAVTAKAPCWEPRWPACDLQGPLRTHASRNRKKWYPAPSGHVKAVSGTGGGGEEED